MNNETIETVPEPLVLATSPPKQLPITQGSPQDAKAQAIAALTMEAYSKASELRLTPEETKALTEDFPDDQFQMGAAGKENLIYLEHCHLRSRLNKVLGPGQWTIVPRQRWAEDYKTGKGNPAVRVYVEGMLIVRGCFVAEAIGDMSYYPNNDSQNYGDACEGAKTEVLRRCCKEMGVGLQAWDKKWIEGWWKRKRESERPVKPTAAAQKPPSEAPKAPTPPPNSPPVPQKPTEAKATAKYRLQALNKLQAAPGGRNRALFTHFAMSKGWLKADQEPETWPLDFVPATAEAFAKLIEEIQAFEMAQQPEIVP